MHALALIPQKLKSSSKSKKQVTKRTPLAEPVSGGKPAGSKYGAFSRSFVFRVMPGRASKSRVQPKAGKKAARAMAAEEGLELQPTGGSNSSSQVAAAEAAVAAAAAGQWQVEGLVDIFTEINESPSQKVYNRACAKLQVVPSRLAYQHLEQTEILLPHCCLGPPEVKALSVALVHNSTVHTLDLHGNEVGALGLSHLLEMLQENRSITNLNLSCTRLKGEGARLLPDALNKNTSVLKLDLSGNEFNEHDAVYVTQLLQRSKNLRDVNLSHNCFRETGGIELGKAIASNSTLRSLDLSWNHLRLKGAMAICHGLQENRGLTRLFLSWNGLGSEGCAEMGRALARNRTLTELDISANRVSLEAFRRLLPGLLRNSTLKILKIGINPITTDGALYILRAISAEDATGLTELDLTDVSVDGDFLEVLRAVQERRSLRVRYGVAIRTEDLRRGERCPVLDTDDPASILFEYMRQKNLRLIDLLHSLDKDRSETLSREELREGLLNIDIPLSGRSMDLMMSKLDINQDGFVDYEELSVGLKDYIRRTARWRKRNELNPEPVFLDQFKQLREAIRVRIQARSKREPPTFV